MLNRALLYFRTIRRMKPSMVLSRLRGQRRIPERVLRGKHCIQMPHIAIPELDLNERYLMRFDVDAFLVNDFLLINERHKVDLSTWNVSEASHLWNFNLHYFEWGIALAACWRKTKDNRYLDCYKSLVRSWLKACPYMKGDAWHPYTISLRLVNWLIAADLFNGELENDEELFSELQISIYRQYRHLLINQETHLRANHWWENLKTLVIVSAAFGEREVLSKIVNRLEKQLDEQILPDGVHFERSLMYHKLVLEGMLRLRLASEQLRFGLPSNFMQKAKIMLDAMASLERGMGKTPFFNDAADGVAKESSKLITACKRLLSMEADDSKTRFPNAGYYKLYDGNIAVMFDAGEPGPKYMLGHAHCDVLSYELSINEQPAIVNAGTYAYQSALRSYFRGTQAHNTAMVGNGEQMECWGEHRVARRVSDIEISYLNSSCIIASYKTYAGCLHQRGIFLKEGTLRIQDHFNNVDKNIISFIHFAPGFSAHKRTDSFLVTKNNISMILQGKNHINSGYYNCSSEFGVISRDAELIQVSAKNDVLEYSIEIHEEESVANND